MSQPSSSVQAVAWRDFVLWIMILITFQKWRRHLAYRLWRAWNTMYTLTAVYAVSTGLQIKKVVLSSPQLAQACSMGCTKNLVWSGRPVPVPSPEDHENSYSSPAQHWSNGWNFVGWQRNRSSFQDLVEKGYGITIMGRLVGDNGEIRDLLPWFVEARTSEARMDD